MQDTFYWPDQNRDDVSHMLDAQVPPPPHPYPHPRPLPPPFSHTLLFFYPLKHSPTHPTKTPSPPLSPTLSMKPNVQGLPDANQAYTIPLHFATDSTHRCRHPHQLTSPAGKHPLTRAQAQPPSPATNTLSDTLPN